MRKTKINKHIHQYERREDGLWYCFDPDCSHYVPKNIMRGPIGRRSLCWGCGDSIVLDEINMEDIRPVCFDCKANGAIVDSPMIVKADPSIMIMTDEQLLEFESLSKGKMK